MVLQMFGKFGFREKSGSLDMGSFVTPKRPPKGSFDCFSKTVHLILLMFCQNGVLIVLQVCAKFQVQEKSGSLDMGSFVTPKRPPKGSFDCFSKIVHLILLIFCQNGALMVLQVFAKCGVQKKSGSPGMGHKGVKTGVKIDFLDDVSKSLHCFFSILYMLIEVILNFRTLQL